MAAKHKRKRRLIDQKQQVRFAIELSLYTMLFPFIAIIVAVGDYSATLHGRQTQTQASPHRSEAAGCPFTQCSSPLSP